MMLHGVGTKFFGRGGGCNELLVLQRMLHRYAASTVRKLQYRTWGEGKYIVSLDICE